ncbi:MAG: bifunctional transaldolase/phosoglucose isomerase, partial [Saprospiraceae bacterium]|nr:bifunctional transaldolase/phosoglucose isomerase [Pyrinomonadaceae bacterium]
MMPNLMTYTLPEKLKQAFRAETQRTIDEKRISRIWEKDASLWTNDDEAKWLGWLDVVSVELSDLQKYRDLRQDIETAGFSDILLMGMGGSSLCPEVLAMTFGKENFHILDSTVPAHIQAIESKIDLKKTLFIVASKSGSTLEPNCFKQYFFDRVSQAVGAEHAGKQFIAITDPGSKMQKVAEKDNFRHIFYGNPEIGGRFSALSAFGLTAASAMGLDVEKFLNNAGEMVSLCKSTNRAENPGAILGEILAVCHRDGRDKLTIFTSPEIHDLGTWLEQLIAESTGKNGVSIIPVDRETMQAADAYGNDRVFVHFTVKGTEIDEDVIADLKDIEDSGHPVISIELENIYSIGKEFFRWEFATAVTGSIMGINPFNQPDVESAKIEARKITDEYESTGSLPDEMPFFEENGISLFSSDAYAKELTDVIDEKTLANYLEAHLWNLEENDYFAILAYVQMNAENEQTLQELRSQVLMEYGVATCLGFGPRFLHSTGQAYKGGANNGVFLQITSDDETDMPVPGQKYTFGVVKAAQARGDFQVLLGRERRALRVHL